MKVDDILTLIKAVSDSELSEVNLSFESEEEGGNTHVSFRAVKGAKEVIVQTAGDAVSIPVTSIPLQASGDAAAKKPDGDYITSPMVGTFYSAPSEGAEPYISVGDTVKKGQVVGIVEAMKLMNEIESPFDGVVEKILVENKEMVGFGQELVLVKAQ